MSITVNIQQALRHLTNRQATVSVSGSSVSECLDFVIGCSWEAWNCSRCPLKERRPSVNEYIDVSADAESSYDLPPD